MNNNTPDGTCYICGHGNTDVIQRHHIIPQRYGGGDEAENLVSLCPTCHDAIERIYDNSFFKAMGVGKEETEQGGEKQCEWRTCSASASYRLEGSGYELHVCRGHRECQGEHCTQVGSPIPIEDEGPTIACDEHRTCYHEDCLSRDTVLYEFEHCGRTVSCSAHTDDLAETEQEIARQERIERKRREYSHRVKSVLREKTRPNQPGVRIEDVYAEFEDDEITEDEIDHTIQSLRDKGEVYSPDQHRVRMV